MVTAYHRDSTFEDTSTEDYSDLKVLTSQGPIHNGESLNEYLEDSDEDEDNFEAHLKFRKKALERELELGIKTENNSKIRKKKE